MELTTKDGATYKTRIDLKLLGDNDTLKGQNSHDADILIASEWGSGAVSFVRVAGEPGIEDTDEFKTLLSAFNKALLAAGKCYLHISKIDTQTGAVEFNAFGNVGAAHRAV